MTLSLLTTVEEILVKVPPLILNLLLEAPDTLMRAAAPAIGTVMALEILVTLVETLVETLVKAEGEKENGETVEVLAVVVENEALFDPT